MRNKFSFLFAFCAFAHYLCRRVNYNTASKDTKKSRVEEYNTLKSEKMMKIYRISEYVARLASCLVATCKPFAFDGQSIEFAASEGFVEQLKHEDSLFSTVNFEML